MNYIKYLLLSMDGLQTTYKHYLDSYYKVAKDGDEGICYV